MATLGYLLTSAYVGLGSLLSSALVPWLGCCLTALLYRATRSAHRPRSRGDLVKGFVAATSARPSAESYARSIAASRHRYDGFNLLLGDRDGEWWYVSNTGGVTEDHCVALTPGVHVLANGSLFDNWDKQQRGASLFRQALADAGAGAVDGLIERLHSMLGDTTRTPPHALPLTGYPPPHEHAWSAVMSAPLRLSEGQVVQHARGHARLSPAPHALDSRQRHTRSSVCPHGPLCLQVFGTRCGTVAVVARDGRVTVSERAVDPQSGQWTALRETWRCDDDI